MILALLLACGGGTPIVDQTYTVGCGMCLWGKASTGCYWAARVDDRILGIGGPGVPTEQDLPSHGPGGMCTMERKATITGTLYEDRIVADRFELAPVDLDGIEEAKPHKH